MRKFHRATIAVVSALTLMLSACSGGSTGGGDANVEVNLAGDYNPLPRAQIKDGGTLTIPMQEFAEQLNPFHANMTGSSADTWEWFNPQLSLFTGDGTYSPNPDYVTKVTDEVVNGKLVLTWDLNKDAVYNDGTPFDWKVFETTWKVQNGENPDYQIAGSQGFDQIESVKRGSSDKQVIVTFKNAYPWWQPLFSSPLHPAMADPEIFNEGYLNKVKGEYGAGPFKVERLNTQDATISFVPNEKWWGDAPKLEKVTMKAMEAQATVNAFKAGELDVALVGDKDAYASATSIGDSIEVRTALRTMHVLISLNSEGPILEDAKVREAIFTGIDRNQIATIRFNGLGYTEELPGSLLFFQTQEGYEDNFGQVVSFDPEKSKQLLDEAGWAAGDDGIREKNGEKLSLRYILFGDSATNKATAAAYQKMMKDIGVELKIEERPTADFSKVLETKDFDFFYSSLDAVHPYGVADIKSMWASDATNNNSGTNTKEMDAEIKDLFELETPEEQIKAANEIERQGFATYGVMPLFNGPEMVAVKTGLANYGAYAFAVVPKEDIGWAK